MLILVLTLIAGQLVNQPPHHRTDLPSLAERHTCACTRTHTHTHTHAHTDSCLAIVHIPNDKHRLLLSPWENSFESKSKMPMVTKHPSKINTFSAKYTCSVKNNLQKSICVTRNHNFTHETVLKQRRRVAEG